MSTLHPPPLPPPRTGWRVQARALVWRYRLPVAAVLLTLAALTAASALRPLPAGSVQVVVAARDLVAGQTLTLTDLRNVSVPRAAAPEGSAVLLTDVAGRAVVVDLPAGTPLSTSLLVTTPYGPPGTVVATVRLADPQMVALLSPGDHVDVLAAPAVGGAGTVVARRALVLPSPERGAAPGLLGACGESPTAVVLAVDPEEVYALSGAVDATLSAFVVP